MAGHSKWAQIKRAKGANDAARGRLFAKIGKEISVAVKLGGTDPNTNSRLATAIAKAKSNNMPNDNIDRCIKKDNSKANFESMTYEGYGIGGVAVLVVALTDNKNRTASEVRAAFERNGGSLGVTGAVSFMFDKVGGEFIPQYSVPVPPENEKAFEKMLDALDESDDVQEIYHNAE